MKRAVALVILTSTLSAYGVDNGDIPVNTADSAKRMIEDLIRTHGNKYKGGKEFLKRLDEVRGDNEKLQALIREAALANPLLDFDRILVVRRKGEANRRLNSHTTATHPPAGKDNELSVISNLRGKVRVDSLYRHPNQGVIKHVDLHWSGERIMFSSVGSNGKWAVLDIDKSGKDLRELTPSDHKDVEWFDGCYLPEDGFVIVCSTAGMQGLPCENGGRPMVNLYKVDIRTKKVRQLTFEQDSDWHPRVMPNGKVMYLRWEYTDTPHYFTRYLFDMNPDGTGQVALWGNGAYFPTAYVWARPVETGGSRIIGIVSGHHAKSETGRLMLIDPSLGRRYPFRYRPKDKIWGPPKSTINIHPEVFPADVTGCVQEIPGWGRDVVGNVHDNQGGGQKYTFGNPWPLDDKYFLVSMKGFSGSKWNLCLVDVFDNMTLIYEDEAYDIFEPIPFAARKKPQVLVDRTVEGAPTTFSCMNIYYGPGLKDIPGGKVKNLRVYAYHYGYIRSGGHESCGLEASWDVKRILGTVPVEDDGSFAFIGPSNTPIAIQPLDADGAALAVMRTWMVGMPGENLSCAGCHESQNETLPVVRTKAANRAPSKIEPWYGPTRPFAFQTEIQPMLNKYCVGCHNEQAKAEKGQISFEKGDVHWKKDQSYLNLVAFTRRPGPESELQLNNPMEWHVSTSPLIQMFRKGHHGVKLDREAWERLYTWIDLNVPHRGAWDNANYEKRRLDLAKLYAGLLDNPEEEYRRILAERQAQEKPKPVIPEKTAKPGPDGLKASGFPMDEASAKKRQGTNKEMELQLAEGVTMRLARIPAGEFVMGSQAGYQDEAPRAVVKISKPFAMGICEVTNKQYAAFDSQHDTRYLDEHGKDHTVPGYIANHDHQPVARISWQEANAFCKWLSQKSGRKVRLPAEAEWEWASRAGSDKQFFYGDRDTDFSKFANLADASRRQTYVKWDGGSKIHAPLNYPENYLYPLRDNRFTDRWFIVDFVQQCQPNAWGLYDMVGNVNEWTASDYKPYPYRDSDGRNAGNVESKKVARGGSWSDRPKTAGSTVRFPFESYQKVYNVGFRVIVEDVADGDFSREPVPPVVAPIIDRGKGVAAPKKKKNRKPVKTKIGKVSALGEANANESSAHAFDGNKNTKWFHSGANKTWIQCQFTRRTKKAYAGYAITSGNDCPERDPMDWRLEGSDDGKKWTLLDRRSGEKFADRNQTKKYTIKSPKAFDHYRMSIDKPLKVGNGIQFSELEFTGGK